MNLPQDLCLPGDVHLTHTHFRAIWKGLLIKEALSSLHLSPFEGDVDYSDSKGFNSHLSTHLHIWSPRATVMHIEEQILPSLRKEN